VSWGLPASAENEPRRSSLIGASRASPRGALCRQTAASKVRSWCDEAIAGVLMAYLGNPCSCTFSKQPRTRNRILRSPERWCTRRSMSCKNSPLMTRIWWTVDNGLGRNRSLTSTLPRRSWDKHSVGIGTVRVVDAVVVFASHVLYRRYARSAGPAIAVPPTGCLWAAPDYSVRERVTRRISYRLAHLQLTQSWWDSRDDFTLVASQAVIEEASADDAPA
jgi:hypothetical protein